jgi:hypothetical protein
MENFTDLCKTCTLVNPSFGCMCSHQKRYINTRSNSRLHQSRHDCACHTPTAKGSTYTNSGNLRRTIDRYGTDTRTDRLTCCYNSGESGNSPSGKAGAESIDCRRIGRWRIISFMLD